MLTDLKIACAVLTRLPVGLAGPPSRAELLQAVHWFPLAGVVVGAAAALVFFLAGLAGLPGLPALLLALATQILATGALHEVGLAATLDALQPGAGRDAAAGRFGTLALILALLARIAALTTFWSPASFAAALVAASAASRAALPAVMLVQPPAPGGSWDRPDPARVALGLGLACAVALALLPPAVAVQALLWNGVAAAAVAITLGRRLGGCSAHGLGAVQQVGEIAFLFSLAADGWPRVV